MEETDIIICLKKVNKDLKNIKKKDMRIGNIFHRCKKPINIKRFI